MIGALKLSFYWLLPSRSHSSVRSLKPPSPKGTPGLHLPRLHAVGTPPFPLFQKPSLSLQFK